MFEASAVILAKLQGVLITSSSASAPEFSLVPRKWPIGLPTFATASIFVMTLRDIDATVHINQRDQLVRKAMACKV